MWSSAAPTGWQLGLPTLTTYGMGYAPLLQVMVKLALSEGPWQGFRVEIYGEVGPL